MKRAFVLTVVGALIAAGSAPAGAARNVKASAKFTVQLANQSGKYEFGQSRIVQSQLDWTPQVPVSLHASPKNDPFKELSLSGRVEKGTQKTSISGSFTCDTTYGGDPGKAEGTFKAR